MYVTFNKNKMVQKYLLEKPDLAGIDSSKAIKLLGKQGSVLFEYFEKANEPRYLYWDKVKRKKLPEGVSPAEFWFLLKQLRRFSSKKTPIKSESGQYFTWLRLSYTEEYLHKIDMHSGGQMFGSYKTLSDIHKQKFISRGILEEAIASSQLEGAHTTRKAAKKMIIENREPRTKDEKMIVNNYKTINVLKEEYKGRELDLDMLFELHSMLTEGTLDPNELNRFRKDKDNVEVRGLIGSREYIGHVPPKKRFVEQEIQRLIDYANDHEQATFTHPVIKAIIIHFWIGYLHPFTDGNGRLARALFYWYLLKNNYWSFVYLPISTVIKKSPTQYAKAYIYSEQDGLDLTYFYDYHMRKILQSIDEFNDYVERQVLENKRVDNLIQKAINLNDRQKHLLHYLLSSEHAYTTTVSHKSINGISRQTATRDLSFLQKFGLLKKERSGKYVHYFPTNKLKRLVI